MRTPKVTKFVFDHTKRSYPEALGLTDETIDKVIKEVNSVFPSVTKKSAFAEELHTQFSKEELVLALIGAIDTIGRVRMSGGADPMADFLKMLGSGGSFPKA